MPFAFLKRVFGGAPSLKWYRAPGEVKDGNIGAVIGYAVEGRHDALDLSGCQLTAKGLAKLGQMENLRGIRLRDAQLEDQAVVGLGCVSTLTHLDLSGAPIHGTCFVKLAPLPALEYLDLSRTGLVDLALEHLLRACPNLVHLDLSGTKISDAGIPKLSEFHRLTRLRLHDLALDEANLALYDRDSKVQVEWDL